MSDRMRISCGLCFVLLAMLGMIRSVGATSSNDEVALSQAALRFVRNVAGIRVDAYNMTSYCRGPISSFLYGAGYTEALVSLSLTSAVSRFEVEVEFIDSYLVSYQLTSESGQAVLDAVDSSDVLKAARETLGRYEAVFNVTYGSQLATMTENIASLNRAQMIETKIATLSFRPNISTDCSATLIWNYRNATRKSLSMSMNKEGVLDWFRDMWGINKISNSEVKVSEQTALKIASDNANDYTKQLGARIADVNVTFQYINSYPSARSGDPFVLYPSWDVVFTFDKVYGDSLSGYFVGVWADTGEVRTALPQGLWGQSPQPLGNSNSPFPEIGVVAIVVFIFSGALVLTVHEKKRKKKAR